MGKVYTYSFHDNFIDRLADFIDENYIKAQKDLNRLAVVFGGKRPNLFLKRQLAKRIGKKFFPPAFFSIDEFIGYVLSKKENSTMISDLDLCYLIYHLAKDLTPFVLKHSKNFAQFLPWAREIISFIEQIDLEDIPSSELRTIELNAQIGYPIPEEINLLLENVIILRENCHRILKKEKKSTRGLQYLGASRMIDKIKFGEFDQILFCNFFYLHKTERMIFKSLYERAQAVLFFQGEENEWPTLKNLAQDLDISIRSQNHQINRPPSELQLYAGFDLHSQIAHVREILKRVDNLDKTVIVLPEPNHLIPLLCEMNLPVNDFNISMGYPLRRSSFYSLFELVFRAQLSRKAHQYYARDYLKILRHPLVKNLKLSRDPLITRILVHKIEEVLTGQVKTSVSGSLFIRLDEITNLHDLYEISAATLKNMAWDVRYEELKEIINQLHRLLFHSWEDLYRFHDFALTLENFLNTFMTKSYLMDYPLNLKIASEIFLVKEEFIRLSFSQEAFPAEEIFRIFKNRIEQGLVAFSGSPLKGLQILGLLETRSLNFDNVIVMDVNEGTLPQLRVYEPFIPREVMVNLKLNRLEQEEEIQRYQLMRLISSAQKVHLVYGESPDKEKSRFIEELIWNKQKEQKALDGIKPLRASFQVRMIPKKTKVTKWPEMIRFLKEFRYSASSINTYVRCPLRFYYQYVLGLSEKADLLEEPESKEVGVFIHELLEDAFRPFMGKAPVIDERFRRNFQKKLDQKFADQLARTMKSDAFLLKKILDVRLNRFLDKESEKTPLREVAQLISVEERFDDQIPLAGQQINFAYKVDRIDRLKDETILIVDYKTGAQDPMPKTIKELQTMPLSRETIKENVRSFQIPLYFYYFHKRYPDKKLNAVFYNLRTLEVNPFINAKNDHHPKIIIEVFLKALNLIMEEILNSAIPFQPDDSDTRYCATCPFYYMCR